jgi:hypothetical protein
MVTVRQFSRGVGKTVRAMERNAQRAARERLLHEKALAREAMFDAAADAAEAYGDLLEMLTSAHRADFVRMDWLATAIAKAPSDPELADLREQAAKRALEAYAPSWFARTFGFAKHARRKLSEAVRMARQEDADDFMSRQRAAEHRREEIAFAGAVVRLEPQALLSALEQHAAPSKAPVEAIQVVVSSERIVAVLNGLEVEDMPRQSTTLLQSGKASQKPLTASKIHELHRDNVCSAAVRVAAEFLRVLPVEAVEILVEVDLLDRGSGHIAPEPVLYLRVTAQALATVNLVLAEPAPLVERLGGHLNWNRKDGFRPIDLTAFDLPAELLGEASAPA